MTTTRREALQAAAASVCAMSLLGGRCPAAENGAAAEREHAMETMRPLDYGLSFVCNTAAANAVRFWVESRTRIMDDAAGTWTDYYQCGSCKSEHTFAERDLFQKNNYDFLPVLGQDYWLIFRRPVALSANYRTVNRVEDLWGRPVLKLKEASEVTVLETWDAIRDATAAAIPIVTQTEIARTETGLRAVIECPTKTMNVSLDKQRYQVDTGPVAFADLTKRSDPQIGCLSLAFLAFNAPDFADFVVEQPTAVVADGVEKCEVYHYSDPFSLPANNRLFALGKMP